MTTWKTLVRHGSARARDRHGFVGQDHLRAEGPSAQSPTVRATLVLAALVLAAALIVGCGDGREQIETPSRDVACATATAAIRRIPRTVPATGSLAAETSVQISTRTMGWVRTIHTQEGQAVAKGAPLISIDSTDLRARKAQIEAGITEARAVLANAEKMVVRFEKLFAEKSVSRQRLDDVLTGRDRAAAGVEAALAQRDELEVQLSYLDIRAPFSGVVARKMIETGDMANPGVPLLVLEQSQRMKVIARLGEKDISSVQIGDTVSVEISSLPDAKFSVPLAKVVPAANPGSRTYDIEAHLDNAAGRLKSGMFARVLVPVGHRDAVTVPAASIIERGQLRGVFIVDEKGFARLRWVRLGQTIDTDIEVLSGLDGQESVVVSAEVPLVEGDRVVH